MKKYQFILIPKNGKGSKWFMNADQMSAGDYVKVFAQDGFETVVDIRNYTIIKH